MAGELNSNASNTSAMKLFEENPYKGSKSDSEQKETGCCRFCGYRWLTVGLISIGMIIIHAQRVNVSVSLLAVYDNLEDKVGSDSARQNLPTNTTWSALQISLLHSGFFGGYLLTQIPAGILSYKVKANGVFALSVLMSCLLNLVLPELIEADIYWATMLIRILQGLSEGFIWPASYVLVNNWTPRHEVNKLAGFVASGSYAGAIIGFPVSGLITHYFGWQYVYYTSGVVGTVWCVLWLIFVYEKPDHHPRISERELLLVNSNSPNTYQFTSWRELPWKRIASSPPFISLCACAFAKGWVFNLLLMQEPTYMHVFGYNIAQNGVLSALPFLMKIIICYISGILADFLANHTSINRTQVRKMFNTIGFGVESLCLFALCFIYDGTAALAVLTTGVSIGGMAVSGWQINHLDLAPRLAGILVAVSQCFSNLAGIFSPLTAGSFIEESGQLALTIGRSDIPVDNIDIYGWHMVFLLSSLIILICCVFYIIFASGEEQDWAKILPSSESQIKPLASNTSSSVSYQTLEHMDQDTKSGTDESIAAN